MTPAPAQTHQTDLLPFQVEAIERMRAAARRTIGKGVTPQLASMLAKAARGMGDGRVAGTAQQAAGVQALAFLKRRRVLAKAIAPITAPHTRTIREAGRK